MSTRLAMSLALVPALAFGNVERVYSVSTTNLHTNTRVAGAVSTGWTSGGSVWTTSDTTLAADGTAARRLTAPGAQTLTLYQTWTMPPSSTVTYSLDVKAGSVASVTFRDAANTGATRVCNAGAGTISAGGTAIVALGGGWFRCSWTISYTAVQTTSTVTYGWTAAGAGEWLLLARPQAEYKAQATPYCPSGTTRGTCSAARCTVRRGNWVCRSI